MNNAEIKIIIEAALTPYYRAFTRKPALMTLEVAVSDSDASALLRVAASDATRIVNRGLKPHFSAVLNRLAEHHQRNGQGIMLNP